MTVGRFARNDKVEVFAALPLFAECSRKELAQIADIAVEADMDPGSVLTREGQAGGLAFVIVAGTAEVRRGDTVLGTVGPGEMVGELALIDGRPRSASVRAIDQLRVLQINADDFAQLLDKAPQFTRNLLRSLSMRIRRMDERWRVEL